MLRYERCAVNVCARAQDSTHSFLGCGCVVMRLEDVVVSVAVAGDVAIEAPVLACHGLQEPVVGARGHTVDSIVAAHQRAHATLLDASLERPHVRVDKISHRDGRIGVVPVLVLSVSLRCGLHLICYIVLTASTGLNMIRIFGRLLKSLDKLLGILSSKVWILTGDLYVAAPPRLAGQVDHWGPEGRVAIAGVHHRTTFSSDLSTNRIPQRSVEAHARGDRVRKLGCLHVPRCRNP
mmetsp:Transcript_23199/g.65836  ORF Transcript_23199/g.65836 Transcript_23199/m.65836 type:complete len:236 (-) Transcript_23199:635-1342(-)